jgi:hypothetical protein
LCYEYGREEEAGKGKQDFFHGVIFAKIQNFFGTKMGE